MGKTDLLMPKRTNTASGDERRVGVELELAGIDGEQLSQCVHRELGGHLEQRTRYEIGVVDTDLGDFIIELDSDYLKRLERDSTEESGEQRPEWRRELDNISSDVITLAAQQFVPWELVTPPIPLGRLGDIQGLFMALRQLGAKGTRHSMRYAFGLHLNPELPDLEAATILGYMRAYFCLYDWICLEEKIDLARKVTPYIRHFDRDYVGKVIDPSYQPDQTQLIEDYLKYNPSRNRSLDMLPLFSHLDEDRVRATVEDARIKSRPTLHYRLPNCDIDNPDWNLNCPWNHWVQVESLAADDARLQRACEAYSKELQRLAGRIDNRWQEQSQQFLSQQGA